MVIHTIVDRHLRDGARRTAAAICDVPCIAALDPLVSARWARYLGAALSTRVGAQHALDNDYFDRIEALNYAIGHDDGQGEQNLEPAPTWCWSASAATSKTPTCIYLAHRGVRAANVPLAPGVAHAAQAVRAEEQALVVGLMVSPDRLIQIRRNRLLTIEREPRVLLCRPGGHPPGDHRRPPAVREPRLAGDRRDPPFGRGDRRRRDEPDEPGAAAGSARRMTPVTLASKSPARAALLTDAGVVFDAVSPTRRRGRGQGLAAGRGRHAARGRRRPGRTARPCAPRVPPTAW